MAVGFIHSEIDKRELKFYIWVLKLIKFFDITWLFELMKNKIYE
ncbi:protein of unknown function [Clostridium beijerinckii]|nr:protein of unknown function [Clostridium beijerinckii]